MKTYKEKEQLVGIAVDCAIYEKTVSPFFLLGYFTSCIAEGMDSFSAENLEKKLYKWQGYKAELLD